jgi:glucokinase
MTTLAPARIPSEGMSLSVGQLRNHVDPRAENFLAADVGGTHARVALVRAGGSGPRDIVVQAYRKYACAEFRGLAELLRAFTEATAAGGVRRCVIACAGEVIDGTVFNDNLVWRVNLDALRESLDLDELSLLNDFEALAYAVADIDAADTHLLCGPPEAGDGPVLVVGPGTGLGAAVRLPGNPRARVLATEAGQIDLAPATAVEREVLGRLAGAGGYVPYESLLSGPGLLTLYTTLCALRGQTPALATPEAVTAACAASDPVAVECLDVFCALLGGFVGNLAVLFVATGGVYLAGGVLPGMRDILQRSRFAERFLDKGLMRQILSRVPVRLIEHGRHGVLGAAQWYLERETQVDHPWRRASCGGQGA